MDPERHIRLLMIGQPCGDGAGWVCVRSAGEALRRVRAAGPRAVVVHVDGAGAAGPCVEVLEELRRRGPGVALLVLASQADERVERLARAAGAHCYVQGGAELVREADLRAWAARQVAAARRGPGVAEVPEARAAGPPAAPGPARVSRLSVPRSASNSSRSPVGLTLHREENDHERNP